MGPQAFRGCESIRFSINITIFVGWVEVTKPRINDLSRIYCWVLFLNPAYTEYFHGLYAKIFLKSITDMSIKNLEVNYLIKPYFLATTFIDFSGKPGIEKCVNIKF